MVAHQRHNVSRGCGLTMMCSTTVFRPELIDLFPELRPASGGLHECAQTEHDAGPFGFPAHARGAQALLDEGLAGGFGDTRADGEPVGDEGGIVHLMAVVVEIGARTADVIADLLRESGSMGETPGLGDEQIQGVGVVLELGAVGVLPVGASRCCGYCAWAILATYSVAWKKSMSCRSVCCSRNVQLVCAPSAMPRYRAFG